MREASPRARRRLERHLAGCASCRRERMETDAVLAALARLPLEAAVPAGMEEAISRRIRATADADDRRRHAWTARIVGAVPVLTTGAVIGLAAVMARTSAHVPDVVRRVAQGIEVARRTKTPVPAEPPAALAAQPDLFVDLPIVRNLDKLRHFDSIAAMEGDDGAPQDGGAEGRPNG